ncbi:MAG: amino acid ABC transporter permease, partial [Roseburia sp.]
MPMQLLTILQFAGILGAYGLLVIGLPALVFYKKFQKERFCVRFLIYLTIGNFYVINLVFLLQLLHISNRVTLLAGTVLPICAAVVRIYGLSPVSSGKKVLLYGSRLVRGTIGLKQLLRKGNAGLKRLLAPQLGRLKNSLRHSFLDWILVALTTSVVLWMYGSNMLEVFGYCAS